MARGVYFSIAVAVLLAISLFGPWYFFERKAAGAGAVGFNGEANFGLREATSRWGPFERTASYDELGEKLSHTRDTASLTQWIVIAAIAVAVISIGIRRRALLAVLTVIALAVIAFFAVAFPSAVNEDMPEMAKLGFWGSKTVSAEVSLGYRPNWGWFLGLAAFVVALVGAVVARPPKAVAPITPT